MRAPVCRTTDGTYHPVENDHLSSSEEQNRYLVIITLFKKRLSENKKPVIGYNVAVAQKKCGVD